MRFLLPVALLACAAAHAQPADCPSEPGPTASIPLDLNLQGLRGVPSGLTGSLYADVPVAPPGGMTCAADPLPPSRDVLAGPPGDVLHGTPAHDLLRGGMPRVEVEPAFPDGSR